MADLPFSLENAPFLTLPELCRHLHISAATGRNWLKSGRLIPDGFADGKPQFQAAQLAAWQKRLAADSSPLLRQRRNRRCRAKLTVPPAYGPENAVVDALLADWLEFWQQHGEAPERDEMLADMLADCAESLLAGKFGRAERSKWEFLVTDLRKTATLARPSSRRRFTFPATADGDLLGRLYLSALPDNRRQIGGRYYTGNALAQKLAAGLPKAPAPELTLFEPGCGSGQLLLHLPKSWQLTQIYACDLDPIAVQLTRVNLALKYGVVDAQLLYGHIRCADFLADAEPRNYDWIIGNPPWGGLKIDRAARFLVRMADRLKADGKLRFLVPEALLDSRTFQAARNRLGVSFSWKYAEFCRFAFPGVSCPVLLAELHCAARPNAANCNVVRDKQRFQIRRDEAPDPARFNFLISDPEKALLEKLRRNPGSVFLKNRAVFALGIVTGDNRKFLRDAPAPDREPVWRGCDIKPYRLAEPTYFLRYAPEKFQQCAPLNVYRAPEKLLYRFIGQTPVFAYDDQRRLSLNSANVLILQLPGLELKYLLAVLNSPAIAFFWQREFNFPCQLLRCQLEALPIPMPDEKRQNTIVRLVEQYLETAEPELERAIAAETAAAFDLSTPERQQLEDFLRR